MTNNDCHTHNRVDGMPPVADKPFGIRVSTPPTDPFNKLVGGDWYRDHWFANERERDLAFDEMRKRHGFYRIGDNPSQILAKISRADIS
ncbi:MAG: hypothetical protein AAF270_07130 [Pseudomonadota bacterium]